jgi:CheY-like chemotaxis protein
MAVKAKGSRVATPILVVDDNPAIREVATMMLELDGYTTISARDGAEALEIIERERPALVLLDMRMPRMDGWSFARALTARGIAIPVIVMTAAQDARRWAAEIDADAYLGKPFQMDTLLDTVERIIGG